MQSLITILTVLLAVGFLLGGGLFLFSLIHPHLVLDFHLPASTNHATIEKLDEFTSKEMEVIGATPTEEFVLSFTQNDKVYTNTYDSREDVVNNLFKELNPSSDFPGENFVGCKVCGGKMSMYGDDGYAEYINSGWRIYDNSKIPFVRYENGPEFPPCEDCREEIANDIWENCEFIQSEHILVAQL